MYSAFRSDYTPSLYQNGESEGNSPTPLEFSFSDLPNLDFGSPDEDEGTSLLPYSTITIFYVLSAPTLISSWIEC